MNKSRYNHLQRNDGRGSVEVHFRKKKKRRILSSFFNFLKSCTRVKYSGNEIAFIIYLAIIFLNRFKDLKW